jgi:glycosyltransferase involved in cell wall biosynthesis
MRVLLLDQFSDPGGAQQCLLDLLPAMHERGWDVMAGLPGNGELICRFDALKVPVGSLSCGPYTSGRKSVTDAARFLIDGPRLARQITRMAAHFRPDVMYVNGPRLLPATALADSRIPVVFHSHSYISSRGARLLAGAGLRRAAARVIACCEFVAQPWRSFVGAGRVTVIYNGVAGPPSITGGKPENGLAIGCIGRIAPEKGQREFVKAAGRIHRAIPNSRFLIHGAPLFATPEASRYESELRRSAAGLPLEFRGWTNNIYEALAELDLILVPSAAYEANARVILEAFSAGVPVIARSSGGIPEVIEHGVNGLLAKSDEDFARHSIELLTGPAERIAKMSECALLTWRRRFTLARYQQQVLDTLASFRKN